MLLLVALDMYQVMWHHNGSEARTLRSRLEHRPSAWRMWPCGLNVFQNCSPPIFFNNNPLRNSLELFERISSSQQHATMSSLTSLVRCSIVPLALLQCHPSFLRAKSHVFEFGIQSRSLCAAVEQKTPSVPDEELLKTYSSLKNRLQEIERLSGISALMSWYVLCCPMFQKHCVTSLSNRDEAVMMPPGSSAARNRQSGALAGVIFEKKTAPELGEELKALSTPAAVALLADPVDAAVIRDATKDYFLQINNSKELVTKSAELEGRGYAEWVTARKENNWVGFKDVLQEIVQVKKDIAAATQPTLSNYDANIDLYERGMSSARIQDIFSYIKGSLDPLIHDIAQSDVKKQYTVPEALKGSDSWDIEQQKAMCLEIAEVRVRWMLSAN